MFSLQLIGLHPNTVRFATCMKGRASGGGLPRRGFDEGRSLLEFRGGGGRIPF